MKKMVGAMVNGPLVPFVPCLRILKARIGVSLLMCIEERGAMFTAALMAPSLSIALIYLTTKAILIIQRRERTVQHRIALFLSEIFVRDPEQLTK